MSKFLDELKVLIEKNNINVYSISEIVNDGDCETIKLQEVNDCQNCYSVSKLVTAVAVGVLYDMGKVKPEDRIIDILGKYFPEEYDKRWEKATVHHALTHTMGLPGGFLDIDCNDSNTFTTDFLNYTFSHELEYTPGEGNMYSDGVFYILGVIIEEKTGLSLDDFCWKYVFAPLKMKEAAWSHCPMGHAIGGSGLYIRSDDLVKIGGVLVNKGKWQNTRILSEEWTEMAIREGYGMKTEFDGRAFGKGGMYGQKLMCIPSSKRAVCWLGYNVDSGIISDFCVDYKD